MYGSFGLKHLIVEKVGCQNGTDRQASKNRAGIREEGIAISGWDLGVIEVEF